MKKQGKHYTAGRSFGSGVLDAIELMYQHGTAYRFLCGLCDILEAEKRRRKELVSKGKRTIR